MNREQLDNLIERLLNASQENQPFCIDSFEIAADKCEQYADHIQIESARGLYIDDEYYNTDIDVLMSVKKHLIISNVLIKKNLREIKEKINTAVIKRNLNEYNILLSELCNLKPEDGAYILAKIFQDNYSSYYADYLAKLLEIAIRKNMCWAHINNERNPLFRLCLIVGSKELYDCFIEETEPQDKGFLTTLYNEAKIIDELIMINYRPVKKGVHYNGCLKTDDNASEMVQIWLNDYNFIEDIVSRYNSIIERRLIIEDLSNKAEDD